MSKLKTGSVIFRRIRGKIIPILAKGSDPAIKAQRMAAKKTASISRKAIKKKIAAKTSLSEKRISAIQTARKFVLNKGQKIDLTIQKFEARVIGKHFVKVPGYYGANKDIFKRFLHKNILSKKGVAPESFLIKTKKRNILVQEKANSVLQHKLNSSKSDLEFMKRSIKYERNIQTIEKKARSIGIKPYDVATNNAGFFGKKAKVFDTDLFELSKGRRGLSLSERKRLKKFTIKAPKKISPEEALYKRSYKESKSEELSYKNILKKLKGKK